MPSPGLAAAVTFVFCLTVVSPQSPEPTPLWVHEADADVTSLGVTNGGDLVVTTDRRAFLLGAEDGAERWTSTELRACRPQPGGLLCRYRDRESWSMLFPNSTYTRFYIDDQVVLFDLANGTTVFNSADRALGKVRLHRAVPGTDRLLMISEAPGRGFAASALKPGDPSSFWTVALPITRDMVYLGEASAGLALIYGRNASGQRVMTALDLESRAVAWSRADLLTRDVRTDHAVPSLAGDDGSLIVFVNKDGPMRLGEGGELVWRAADLAGKDPQTFVRHGDVVIVYQDGKLIGLDYETGAVRWRHDPKADLYGFEVHTRGFLVWSQKNTLNLLDPATGESRWTAPAAIPRGWSPAWWSLAEPYRSSAQAVVVDDQAVLVAGRSELARVDLQDGRTTTVAVYEFGDGEVPVIAERRDGDVLLVSSQNIARFAPDGTRRYHRHRRAPGVGTLARLGQFAAAGVVSNGRGFPVGSGRINASRMTEHYHYMYFEGSDDDESRRFGLVRIDKATGDEAPVIWINDRSPAWVLNPDARVVMYLQAGRRVVAVRY